MLQLTLLCILFGNSNFYISNYRFADVFLVFPNSGITCGFKRITSLNCGTYGFPTDFNILWELSSDYVIDPFSFFVASNFLEFLFNSEKAENKKIKQLSFKHQFVCFCLYCFIKTNFSSFFSYPPAESAPLIKVKIIVK